MQAIIRRDRLSPKAFMVYCLHPYNHYARNDILIGTGRVDRGKDIGGARKQQIVLGLGVVFWSA